MNGSMVEGSMNACEFGTENCICFTVTAWSNSISMSGGGIEEGSTSECGAIILGDSRPISVISEAI